MADTQQSSFIPKAPVRKEPKVKRTRRVYILSYLSFVLFFGSLIATGIVFLVFGAQAQGELSDQKARLESERSRFADSSLQEVRELNLRITEATKLLNRHIAPVRIMEALEFTLLQSVTAEEFLLEKQEDGTYRMQLTAYAPTFNAARFQREILTGNAVLAGAQFTETQYGILPVDEQDKKNADAGEDEGVAGKVLFKLVKYLTPQDIPHEAAPQVQDFQYFEDDLSAAVGEEFFGDFLDDGAGAGGIDNVIE